MIKIRGFETDVFSLALLSGSRKASRRVKNIFTNGNKAGGNIHTAFYLPYDNFIFRSETVSKQPINPTFPTLVW
ncbi:hypothetical protein Cal6303_4997 [Calothrix sp. PCC 6303]|nr:hypothetical protein Cal6303_4997 [Calothrix sp. PCC 6303]